MPLNKIALSAAIKSLVDNLSTRTENPEQARQDFADQLADAVDTFVKTGTVITTGSATTQTGNIT